MELKYLAFGLAAVGALSAVFLLAVNRKWLRWPFWLVILAFCKQEATAINFFSHEEYRGSSRGMEISLVHLCCVSVLGALVLHGRPLRWFPDAGSRLYALFFLLCLPSMTSAANALFGWFELWKMLMMGLVFATVFNYLLMTGDLDLVLDMLAVFVLANALCAVYQHYTGYYQARGFFPHQNSLGLTMLLVGPVFCAEYLHAGLRGWRGKLRSAAFGGAVLATLMTYSRGAIVFMILGYGLTILACFFFDTAPRMFLRSLPLFAAALAVAVEAAPQVLERFRDAPEASANTRIELAHCAEEMIKDEPLRGVGINNWGIKINPPYEYADRAGRSGYARSETMGDGLVETVYLLVCAECGIPALSAMLLWFGWYAWTAFRLTWRLRGAAHFGLAAGLFGGLVAVYAQSCLEWVLRQAVPFAVLMICFATLAYLPLWDRHRRMNPEEAAA